ncbi:hypothetical protein R5R35_000569 [Gryllus longicercus]|uniref:Uncharacterized protein n=1 Tax=Gryllus longicercus TaxID=2509291 RepID=A0AAN9VF30_9ORTH
MSQTTLTGDGRRVRVALNRGRVLVVGNGADVRVERNEGEVRVVGNGGRVRVLSNARGCVHYVGDGGCVRVGGGGRVDYAGSGGHVERHAEEDAAPCACPAPSPAPSPAAAPLVRVAHRPHAHAAFRELPVRTNAPATAITINVASAADAERWRAKFAQGFWIAT